MKFGKPLVEIKGFGGKLGLLIDGTALFDQVEDELKKLLRRPNSRQLLKGAEIFLHGDGRRLNTNEFYRLKRILKYEGDLHLISEPNEGMNEFSQDISHPEQQEATFELPTGSLFPAKGYKTTEALIVRQTLHSGQAFRSQNGVILLGDMNAGAEIVSDHDVVILGTLRGTVHAGASGNRKALVFALRMQPTQLRIAELITQPPREDKRSTRSEPEVAFIEEGSIIIETCQKIRV